MLKLIESNPKELIAYLRPHESDGVLDLAARILAFIVYFEINKLIYPFDDFQLEWIYDWARMIKGERVHRFTHAIKETGKSTLTHAMVVYSVVFHSQHRNIVYQHSNQKSVEEFINGIYNFVIREKFVKHFGFFIAEQRMGKEKKRYTNRMLDLVQNKRKVKITGVAGKGSITGLVDMTTGARPDLLILDDPATVLTAVSETESENIKRTLNELMRSLDQTRSSVLVFMNPIGRNHVADFFEEDERFSYQPVFLYNEQNNLRWKADVKKGKRGKYVETDKEVIEWVEKYGEEHKPASVEHLKKDPDFEKTFLGKKVLDHEVVVFIERSRGRNPIKTTWMHGAEVKWYGEMDKTCVHFWGSDHSKGHGGDNQAFTLINGDERRVIATMRTNNLETDAFIEIAWELYSLEDFSYNFIFCPERDGGQGDKFIEGLRIRGVDNSHFFQNPDTVKKKITKSPYLGYGISKPEKIRAYENARIAVKSIDVACKDIIEEAGEYTYEMLYSNADSHVPKMGNLDLLRSFVLAVIALDYKPVTSIDKMSGM